MGIKTSRLVPRTKKYADSLVAKNSFHVEAFEQMNSLLVMERKDWSWKGRTAQCPKNGVFWGIIAVYHPKP